MEGKSPVSSLSSSSMSSDSDAQVKNSKETAVSDDELKDKLFLEPGQDSISKHLHHQK